MSFLPNCTGHCENLFFKKTNKKMEKNHLWQRLGQDEDKEELEEEDDEVT